MSKILHARGVFVQVSGAVDWAYVLVRSRRGAVVLLPQPRHTQCNRERYGVMALREPRTVTVAPGYSDEGDPGQFHHLPYDPYPRHREPEVPDESAPLSAGYVRRTFRDLKIALDDMATLLTDESHRVDEYPGQAPGQSATSISWQADYKGSELIESIIVTGPSTASGTSTSNEGTVATPATNAFIVTVTAPASGLYNVTWSVEVKGAAATLADNYKLLIGALTNVAIAEQGIAIGVYPQQSQAVFLSAGTTMSILAIATEATATITGEITLTPYTGSVPFTLQLGRRNWTLSLPPTGILVIAPIKLSLSESSTRSLTASIAGNWAVELMGITDSGRIGRPGSV